jgi:hypothetical protein
MRITRSHNSSRFEVECLPVYNRPDGSYEVPDENRAFWEATPAGKLELSIDAGCPGAEPFREGGALDIGQAFLLDFTPTDG